MPLSLPNQNLQQTALFALLSLVGFGSVGQAKTNPKATPLLSFVVEKQVVVCGPRLLLKDLVAMQPKPKPSKAGAIQTMLASAWPTRTLSQGTNYILADEIASQLEQHLPKKQYAWRLVGEGAYVHYSPSPAEEDIVEPNMFEAEYAAQGPQGAPRNVRFEAQKPSALPRLARAQQGLPQAKSAKTTYHLPKHHESNVLLRRGTPIWVRYEKGGAILQAKGALLRGVRLQKTTFLTIKMGYGGQTISVHATIDENLFFRHF